MPMRMCSYTTWLVPNLSALVEASLHFKCTMSIEEANKWNMDWWEILSLTGVFVPNKSVGMNHPMGGMTIRVRGAGEAIQGRIGGSVIVATAVVVCLTTYDLHGEEKRKRQHTAGPGAAGPNASTKGELPSVHEAQTGGEELAAAGPEAQKGGEEQPS
ncbi:hypothetical protein RJ641_016473 [Dillenia turbinata]|uniref:Uncharacterized protein n=1 Tax=Dillenia turbinata TaxID=194707 RepID=A0AAN8UTZ9_9MAGN